MPIHLTLTQQIICVWTVVAVIAVILAAVLLRRRPDAAVKHLLERPTTPAAPPADPWPTAPTPPPSRTLQRPRLAVPPDRWPVRTVPVLEAVAPVVDVPVAIDAPARRLRLIERLRGAPRHEGAIAGWSPRDDVEAAAAAQQLTPIELLPREALMEGLPEPSEPSMEVLRVDVHHALGSLDSAISTFRSNVDASTVTFNTRIDTALAAFAADRQETLRALIAGEHTAEIDMRELRELLARKTGELVAA